MNTHVAKEAHVSETFVPAQSLNPWIVLQQNPRSVIADPQLLVIVAPNIHVVANIHVKYAQVIVGNRELSTVVNFHVPDHVNPGYTFPALSLKAPLATSM